MIISVKAVFTWQNANKFLQQVLEIANRVVVWTKKFKRYMEPIAKHLFCECKAPYNVLDQEHYTKIELTIGKSFHRGYKMYILKVLSKALFSNPSRGDLFGAHNILLIDNSPNKSICNDNANAIFFDTWSYAK